MQNLKYLLLLSFMPFCVYAGESSEPKAKWIRCDNRWQKQDLTKKDLESRLHSIKMTNIDIPYAAAIIEVILVNQQEEPNVIARAVRQKDIEYRFDLKRYVTFMGCGHVISSQLKENRGHIFKALLQDRPEVLHVLSSKTWLLSSSGTLLKVM